MDGVTLIQILKTNKAKLYMTVTGGGTGSISKLLENGGASEVFVGAEIPYGYYPKFKPVKHVSSDYAEELALHSWSMVHSSYDVEKNDNIISVGVTAGLMRIKDERPDRVNDAYIAISRENPFGAIHRRWRHVLIDKVKYNTRLAQENFLSDSILEYIGLFVEGKIK